MMLHRSASFLSRSCSGRWFLRPHNKILICRSEVLRDLCGRFRSRIMSTMRLIVVQGFCLGNYE